MKALLTLCVVLCKTQRLLSLKGQDDVFVSHTGDTLALSPPLFDSFQGQIVSIHNRTLYFEEGTMRYSLVMQNTGIEVKLVPSPSNMSRVSFLTKEKSTHVHLSTEDIARRRQEAASKVGSHQHSQKRSPQNVRVRNINLHDLLPQKKSISSYGGHSDHGMEHDVADTGPVIRVVRGSAYSHAKPRDDTETHSDDEVEHRAAPAPTPAISSEPVQAPEPAAEPAPPRTFSTKKEVSMKPGKTLPAQIESDSNFESDGEFAIKNVTVTEQGDSYFTLTAEGNICITYFKEKFIFSKCNKSDQQLFKVITVEEVKKKQGTTLGISSFLIRPAEAATEGVLQRRPEIAQAQEFLNYSSQIVGNRLATPAQPQPQVQAQAPRAVSRVQVSPAAMILTKGHVNTDVETHKPHLSTMPNDILDKLRHTIEAANLSEF